MKKKQLLLLVPAILLSSFVTVQIYRGIYSQLLVILWLLSILFTVFSSVTSKINILKTNIFSWKKLIIFFVILLPVLVRVFNYDLTRIHGDDLLTAYFSAHYDFNTVNFFSMIPQTRTDWVSQFPTPYFALQKIFFLFFGENLLTVKLSVTPYIFIVSLGIFFIVKKLLDEKAAIIAIILYAFFSISMYFETLGLHFVASTAMFTIFFYFLFATYKNPKSYYSLLAGVFCAFSYLFYASSYIALPILFLFFVLRFIVSKQKILTIINASLALISFLIVLGPFLAYALTFNNYFSQRIEQVSLLDGTWSNQKQEIQQGKSPIAVVEENFSLAVQSLYEDGIGGHGGYTFSRLAFFEKFSLILFTIGVIQIFFFSKKNKFTFLVMFGAIFLSFFTGIVLTIPPPAYHRFSLAFPFIAIAMMLPFNSVIKTTRTPVSLKLFLIIMGLSLYIVFNQLYFTKAAQEEHEGKDGLRLAQYIKKNFSDRVVYVASFPGFHLDKFIYFVDKEKKVHTVTNYHKELISKFNPNEKFLYVILFPDQFNSLFTDLNVKAKLVKFSSGYSLFYN